MERIIECVPNFSEGRNMEVIDAIVAAIEKGGREAVCDKPGVKVLDVDPGEATNRTVVTFVGSPEAVVEAAFQGVKKAAELIDMSKLSESISSDTLDYIKKSKDNDSLKEPILLRFQEIEWCRIARELMNWGCSRIPEGIS